MLGQQLCLNSMYGGLFANPTAGLAIGARCDWGKSNWANGDGFRGYTGALAGQGIGNLGGSRSLLGTYSGSTTAPVLQGLQHTYSGSSMGQASTKRCGNGEVMSLLSKKEINYKKYKECEDIQTEFFSSTEVENATV